MISTYHQAIIDKLSTIPNIQRVTYSYDNGIGSYPHGCAVFVSMAEEYETQIQVRRIYVFNIMLQTLVLDGDDRNVVYKQFEDIIADVYAKFGRNSIDGATLTRPTESIVYEEMQEEREKLMATISLQVENIERVSR